MFLCGFSERKECASFVFRVLFLKSSLMSSIDVIPWRISRSSIVEVAAFSGYQRCWWSKEGNNFYNTRSRDSSRNNTGRRYERVFWVQNPRYKGGTLLSLWKAFLKMCLGFPLYTRRSRSETLILNGLELLFGLN